MKVKAMNAQSRSTVRLVGAGASLATLLYGGLAAAQVANVTPITIPTTGAVAVTALNNRGNVTGYTTEPSGVQRAFFWDGAALDLGTLGGGSAQAFDLNDFDQTTGYGFAIGNADFRAFLGIGQTLIDLGSLGGNSAGLAINNAGVVTGYSFLPSSGSFHAILSQNGLLYDLGTLGGGLSSGLDINEQGEVVGDSELADFSSHGFFHDGLTIHDLGTLGGTYSSAVDVNNHSEATGGSTLADDMDLHAVLYSGGVLSDLGTLGGTFSFGYKVNDSGTVAGDSALAGDGIYQGFIWRAGVMTSLGHLGSQFSSVWSLNNSNQIVGVSTNASGQSRAFLWQNGTMIDLNSTLPAGSGWVLDAAYHINDAGQIVGTGLIAGQPSWYRLELRANENHPPVARAGADTTAECGGHTVLDGSASSDADGDALSFAWFEGETLLGQAAQINVALSAGVHTLRLRVTDAQGASAEDEIVVTVRDTTAPALVCPGGQTAAADAEGGAALPDFAASTAATDGCSTGEQLVRSQHPVAGTRLACGVYPVTVTVVDPSGNVATCQSSFTVADTTPPQVEAPELLVRTAGSDCAVLTPKVVNEVHATDNCTPSDQLVVTQSPAAGTVLGLGEHAVEVRVADAAGNVTVKTVTVRVVDKTAPQILALTASPNVIRPANNKLTPVDLSIVAVDNCDDAPVSSILSVESSDPFAAADRGGPDWIITGDLSLEVRAEVSRGESRTYSVVVATTDKSGNRSTGTVQIVILKNKNSDPADAKSKGKK
jgi:probable HAF family extracellular repeat protein